MSVLLQAELLKLRTTRTFLALVGATLLLSLLIVVLSTILSDTWNEEDVRDLFFADFSGLFILLLGVIGMAGEWRHRTITSTFLAAPDRLKLLTAKVLSYAVAGAVLSFIVTVTIMVVGTVILSIRGETTIGIVDMADVMWRNLALAALFGAIGVCVGGLIRNQVVAIVGLLVLSFALEPAIIGLAPDVGQYLPTGGAPNGVIGGNPFDEDAPTLAPGIALLVELGWVALLFAAAAATLRKRDLV